MIAVRLPCLARRAVLVAAVALGVLVMHGVGDPSMDHGAMSTMTPVDQGLHADGGTRDHAPAAPAGDMAMGAACAFAIVVRTDTVSRLAPRRLARRTSTRRCPSLLVVGPEPPVPRPV